MKIKRILFIMIILFGILLISNISNATVGEEFIYDSIKYKVLTEEIDNYTVEVLGYEEELENVVIPQNVTNGTNTYKVTAIGEKAFKSNNMYERNTFLKSITMPNTVTTIKNSAFEKCEKLEKIEFSTTLKTIGEYAFCDCKSLKNIVIPNSVTLISASAFAYAESLENITLSNSLTTIESDAFSNCISLTIVIIPASVTSIGNNVFETCKKLKEINVASGNTKYSSEEGILFDYDKTQLVCYPASKEGTTYTIPSSVTTIEHFAFKCSKNLKSIEIPNSVTNIKSSAFDECTALTNITIPDSITKLEQYTFCWCSNLKRVNIPNSVTTIVDDTVFRGCNSLIIFCNDGSYAKQYALNNSINSKPLYYYSVINDFVNVKSNGVCYAHPEEGDYITTLTPNEGHVLPKNIKVEIAHNDIEYDYDSTTGKLLIPKSNITGDITIEAAVYKVVFDANGGIFASNDEETLVFDDWQSDDYINLEKPTRDGYKFVGYYTEKEEGTSFDHYYNESGVDKDMILYARWETVKTFTEDSSNQTFEIGTDKTLSFTLLIEDTDKENRTVYIDGEKLSLSEGDYTSQNIDSYPYITISENYMKTLKTGTHTIKIVLKDGTEAETTFEIIAKTGSETAGETMTQPDGENAGNIVPSPTAVPTIATTNTPENKPTTNNPQTGDDIFVFIGVLVISLIGIIAIRKYKK